MALLEGLATTESSTSSVTFVPDVKQKVGFVRDTSQLINPYFPDLVSNHFFLNNFIFDHSTMVVMNDGTPLYEEMHYILDIEDDIIADPQKYVDIKSMIVKVPSDGHYTCDRILGNGLGMDRLHEFQSNPSHKKKYDNFLKKHGGWIDDGSNILIGYVRWVFDSNGFVIGFVIIKVCGNGRDYMKVTANGGNVCDHIMKLIFHEINPEYTYEDYQSIEAKAFRMDQQDITTHNAETKFMAGVKASDVQWVTLRDYLKSFDLDFKGIISSTTDQVPQWEISSFEGFTFGNTGKPAQDNREFKHSNIAYALDTLKTIQEKREEIGVSEIKSKKQVPFKYISNTALRVLIRMFEMLTDPFTDSTKRRIQPLISKDDLKADLVFKYTRTNRKCNKYLYDLSELNMKGSGNIKDFYFVGMYTNIIDILKELNEGRNNRIMEDNPVIKRYINKISERILQDEIKKLIRDL